MKPDVPNARIPGQKVPARSARPELPDTSTSPVRQLFESALREGPLFRPEGVVADEVSETSGAAAAQKYLAKAKGKDPEEAPDSENRSGGWIFITDGPDPGSDLRIALSERSHREDAADFTTEALARHLGVASDETLRYAAFSHDAYRALATSRDLLKVFETNNRRYRCPSAVAATAIESLRHSISSRKTNFENVTGDSTAALMGETLTTNSRQATAPVEDDQRVERHAAIANLMQETERSLSEASDMLEGVSRKKGRYRRQLPGIVSRRLRRDNGRSPDVPTLKSEPKLATRSVLTAPVVQTMEQAIMRREAGQFMRQRRDELKKITLLVFTIVTTVVAFGLLRFGAMSTVEVVVGAIGSGLVTTILARAVVQQRYAKPTVIWKEILDRPVQAPR